MYLYAATLSPNTLAPKTTSLRGLNQAIVRFAAIEQAAADVRAAVDADLPKRANKAEPYLIVLLAPEYFFSRDPASQKRFIDQDIKKYVVNQLRTLSKQHIDMVIVPGTVPWWRPAHQGNAKDAPRVQKALGRIQTGKTANWDDDNYLGLRGWSYSGPGHDTYQEYGEGAPVYNAMTNTNVFPGSTIWPNANPFGPEKKGKDERWLQKPHKQAYIAQNTAYIAYAGQVLVYHKVGSFQEVVGENEHRVVYVPGNQKGFFNIGSLRCGLEICRDHVLGVLAWGSHTVDLQLIVSATVDNIPASYNLSANGVLVHADSTQSKNTNVSRVEVTGSSTIQAHILTKKDLSVSRVYMPAVAPSGNLKGQKLVSSLKSK